MRQRVAVFCDGDFWHGRELETRIARLKNGHNAPYWVAKITSNVARDRRINQQLGDAGWEVLRFWEADVKRDANSVADAVAVTVKARSRR